MTVIGEQLRRQLASRDAADRAHGPPPGSEGETEAAVLVPLYLDEGGALHAVFTKRREDLRRHAGEISFPGGRREHPAEPLDDTALREAEEEIGLAPDDVELLGTLTPVRTFATGYVIYPHVGLIAPGRAWVPSPSEVAAVIELPLRVLADAYGVRPVTRRGFTLETDTYVVGEHLIWGATARILGELLERLRPLLARPQA
jgi:8-oxo-dGTP pyrophosphatase MutT (NUDIX family)